MHHSFPVSRESEPVEDEGPMIGEDTMSPELFPAEEGSGSYEGSGFGYIADQAFAAESEAGSGERDMDLNTGNFSF